MCKHKVSHSVLLFLLCVLLILLLSNCSPTQTTPTIKPTETHTQTSTVLPPTTQLEPTQTRTPDLTRPDTVRPTYAAEATQRSLLPSPTPISLGTPIPETAIAQPLSEAGPWLLYHAAASPYTWFVINADGTGRTEIKFPKAF